MKERLDLIIRDIKRLIIPGSVFLAYILVGRIFLKSLCPSVIVTGFPCPGCGMTRAMFSILRGDFMNAWNFHPFSYAVILFALWFCVWRYVLLKDMKMVYNALVALMAGLIIFYIYRMIVYFPGDPPMSYYYGSYLSRVLNLR